MSKFEMFTCKFCVCGLSLLYLIFPNTLNDEVNVNVDPRVPGTPIHPKIGQMNFWKPPSLYPTFNFKWFIPAFSGHLINKKATSAPVN